MFVRKFLENEMGHGNDWARVHRLASPVVISFFVSPNSTWLHSTPLTLLRLYPHLLEIRSFPLCDHLQGLHSVGSLLIRPGQCICIFISFSNFLPTPSPPTTHTHTHTQSCLYCFCAIGPLSNQLIPFSLASSPGEVPENTHRMKKWTALGFFPFYSIILQVLPT